jgi:putative endonuclease
MRYSFYIIYSIKLDRYYLGHTEDLVTRLDQHNSGISSYTSKTNDWQLVYAEYFADRKQARDKEREVKKKKSREYIKWLISKKV